MCPPTARSKGRSGASARGARRPGRCALALGLCLALVACRTPPAPVASFDGPSTFTTEAAPELFGLGAGDVVTVRVAGHDELSTPPDGTALDDRGALYLPMVGEVVLGGASLGEAQRIARDAFAEYMNDPSVVVALEERASTRFHVLGQIQHPGPHPMAGPMTALEALGAGGMFLNAADRFHVFLVRPHAETIEVHTFDAETPGPDGLVQVLPGDIVFVRRRGTQRFQEEFLPLLAPWQIALPLAGAAGAFD